MSEGTSAAAGSAAASAGQAGGEAGSEQSASQQQSTQAAEAATGEQDAESGEEKIDEGAEKPPKHKFHDVLTEYYPDREFASDEDYDNAYSEYVGEHVDYRKRSKEANDKLIKVLDENPQLRELLTDTINNAVPFNVALAKHYGPDDLTLQEGDDHYADFDANRKAREQRLAEKAESDKAYNANMEKSQQTVREFAAEQGMSEQEAADMLSGVDAMMSEVLKGIVSKETLLVFKKGMAYDEAVDQAADIAGKKAMNKKIVEERKETQKKGDGMPHLAGGGESQETTPKPKGPLSDVFTPDSERDPVAQALARNKK